MILAKRGNRAGATSLEGGRTNVIHLKHSDDGILWEQTLEPVVKEKAKREPKEKKTKDEVAEIRKKAAAKDLKFLDVLISNVTRPMKKTEIVKLAIDGGHGSYYLVKKHWKKIEERLLKNTDGLFLNPEQKT